ncbi:ferredoxin--NADP(+) reductase [Candidatus Pantoea carbekii]|uniref:Flavodoxin/ferredoxin--NADP reductase n=1 Tax=Candidatus Pantoea carbekii TaxID=1235990 RepID=U3U745_9GAMM|nr:ferredoxin--NADP(+) reductase [Candidatus Pantoea carbekii]AKC32355.1 ferredoxin-NADP reductase Fpr [Candidatus Pantoea carbekii]BAO00074.1 Fpr protein [Candidatus Pantoea carbekii]
MTDWINAEVKDIKHWTDKLFSLRIEAPINPFIAGQFSKLALEINGERIQRAYSYVNAPKDSLLDFYIVTVENGQLSPRLKLLQPGDGILIAKDASGVFLLREIPDCQILWMISTGTAIGPYLSILQQGENLERFEKIVLVHAVRYATDLNFLLLFMHLQKCYAGKLHIQSVVSREKIIGALYGRIPSLIENGQLEESVGIPIKAENTHVMLCGNPQMVRDTQKILETNRNMRKHFKHKFGQISSEFYW